MLSIVYFIHKYSENYTCLNHKLGSRINSQAYDGCGCNFKGLNLSYDFTDSCLHMGYFLWVANLLSYNHSSSFVLFLTHWGRVTHICVGKLVIIGSDNGLSPDRRQTIIWINAGLLSIGPLRKCFSENLVKIQQFSLKKLHVEMSSAKWRPSCLGLNVLNTTSASYARTT